MQHYVMTQYINRLLSGPWYFRGALLMLSGMTITLILIHQFVNNLWDTSNQLDRKYDQLNTQLLRYQGDRDQINQDYKQLIRSSGQFASLQRQFSRARSEDVEIWLIQTAIHNYLSLNEIQVNTQLYDEQGEYFSITCKLSGLVASHQGFLEDLISSDYFLIWEKLKFEMVETGQMNLTIAIKQYVQIHDSTNVSS